MGSYRSSGRGIQVPLLAIANEFIRIHVYTCLHVHTYEILYLGQNPLLEILPTPLITHQKQLCIASLFSENSEAALLKDFTNFIPILTGKVQRCGRETICMQQY